MALMYVPRQNNMQNQMFNVLSNLMFQKMAHKQRLEIADQQTKTATALFNAKTEQDKIKLEELRPVILSYFKNNPPADIVEVACKVEELSGCKYSQSQITQFVKSLRTVT